MLLAKVKMQVATLYLHNPLNAGVLGSQEVNCNSVFAKSS